MKAIVLAAGVGSRLRPLTDSRPKCLVEVGGRPIIDWQLSAYEAVGIAEVTVVAGYMAERIQEFCSARSYRGRLQVLVNDRYQTTNNLFSLAQALEVTDCPAFISNADVVFDAEVVRGMVGSESPDLIAVEVGGYNEESMKIVVDDGHVRAIAKTIGRAEAFGTSIDVYKFGYRTLRAIRQIAVEQFEQGYVNQWTETAIDTVLKTHSIKPFDIGRLPWMEIDNLQDLAIAEELFANNSR